MKISEAVEQAMDIRPSDMTQKQLIQWVIDLDGQLMLDYVSQYATDEQLAASYAGLGPEVGIPYYRDMLIDSYDPEDDEWQGYYNDDLNAVQAPYDDLYVDYLVMQIDLHNADYERYNNDAMLYSEKLKTWRDRLSRNHLHRLGREDPDKGIYRTRLSF